jgi:hypothetical protein
MSAKEINDPFPPEGIQDRLVVLSAIRPIRKMRGSSQSTLVQCEDGRYYIAKLAGNPQGSNVLANEFLGGAIAGSVGLPVPESRVIYLSDTFIDSNPDVWFETPSGMRRPRAGMHYGSRLIGEPSGPNRPTEYIRRSSLNAITNRSAFLGMYIMDVWANHQDNRQAILVGNPVDRTLKAFFIDHGHMFGGPNGLFQERAGVACHLELSIYFDLWIPETVGQWISQFESTVPEILSSAISITPTEWYNGDLRVLQDLLLQRLRNLTQLVESDAKESQHFVHRNLANDILQLPSVGVRDVGTAT